MGELQTTCPESRSSEKVLPTYGNISRPSGSPNRLSKNLLSEPHRFQESFLGIEQRKRIQVEVVQQSQNLDALTGGEIKSPQEILPGTALIKDKLMGVKAPPIANTQAGANRIVGLLKEMPAMAPNVRSHATDRALADRPSLDPYRRLAIRVD